jgi:hypothetical protein
VTRNATGRFVRNNRGRAADTGPIARINHLDAVENSAENITDEGQAWAEWASLPEDQQHELFFLPEGELPTELVEAILSFEDDIQEEFEDIEEEDGCENQ